ncbi:MAG TPA: pitrilysin family protein [Longimicrobiaceae bacterium]
MGTNATPTPERVDRSQPPGPGPRRPFAFPVIERFELANGLPVLTARTEGLPVATLALLVPASGVFEPEDRAGLASLSGALLDSGTDRRSAFEIAETFESLGAHFGVGTGWDTTEVELTALTSTLSPGTELMAELVRSPSFPGDEVDRVRKEHIASILQRRAEPRGLANEVAARFFFAPESPFSRPLGGTTHTLQGLTRQDIVDFHRGHYTPFGATLVVAGNLDPEDVRDLAEATFGDWVGPASVRPVVSSAPAARARRVVIVDRPGSVQSELRVGHVGVARSTPDYFPLIVMNTILGGAFTSRLNLNLREKQGFTYGVSSGFAMRRNPGPFVISTAVQSEVTAAALTEIFREVEAIRDAPVSASELQDARNYIAGVFPLRLETTEGVTARLVELALHGLPLDYFDAYRDRVLEVPADEVLRVARQHVRPEEMCVVIVGDAAQVRGPVEALDLGPVEVVNVEDLP